MRVPGVRFVQGRNSYSDSTKYAVAFHATANTAPAVNEAQYATDRTDGVGAHAYVDNIELIQSLDTNASTWHAGNVGNTVAIAVEITGLNSWSRAKWLSSVAWDRLGAWLAVVSRHHNIPATRLSVAQMKANSRARGAYDHNQMRQAWGGTDHTDPGPNFPWDHLLAVWQRHLSPEDDVQLSDKLPGGKAVGEIIQYTGDKANIISNQQLPALSAKVDVLTETVAALVATPPGTVVISDEQLERVMRRVLGSVDGASPA